MPGARACRPGRSRAAAGTACSPMPCSGTWTAAAVRRSAPCRPGSGIWSRSRRPGTGPSPGSQRRFPLHKKSCASRNTPNPRPHDQRPGLHAMTELIDEAQAAGARPEPVCAMVQDAGAPAAAGRASSGRPAAVPTAGRRPSILRLSGAAAMSAGRSWWRGAIHLRIRILPPMKTATISRTPWPLSLFTAHALSVLRSHGQSSGTECTRRPCQAPAPGGPCRPSIRCGCGT